jgi:hypothetical protein
MYPYLLYTTLIQYKRGIPYTFLYSYDNYNNQKTHYKLSPLLYDRRNIDITLLLNVHLPYTFTIPLIKYQ